MNAPAKVCRLGIIDCQKLFRESVGAVFASQPAFEVVCEAEDGIAAVEAVRRHQPDLVLMDMRLPRMDGPDAARAITGQCASTRILTVTGGLDQGTVRRAFQTGVNGYLAK